MNSTIDSKRPKWPFIFYFYCFEDKNIDLFCKVCSSLAQESDW